MAVFEYSVNLKNGISGPAKSAATDVRGLADQMKSAQGSSMDLQAELAELTGGLSVVAEGVAAVGGAFGALVVAGAGLAIEASEIKERLTATFDALGEGKISGEATIGMLDKMSDSLGFTRKSLAPLAQEFLAMGIQSEDALQGMITAAKSAEALGGSAENFVTLQKKIQASAESGQKLKLKLSALAGVGLTVSDVAKEMGVDAKKLGAELKAGSVDATKFGNAMQNALEKKGADPLQKMGNSLSNQMDKLKESFMELFEGIDVGPFLSEVRQLFDIFSQGKPSGQALKAGIGGFFKEVFALATKLVPMVKHFLLDMVIYGLKAYIALKPIAKWFIDLTHNATVMKVVTSLFKALATAVGVVAVVFGAAVLAGAAVVGALLAIQVAIVAAVGWVLGFVSDTSLALGKWVSGAVSAASDFVSGLVQGIKNGAGMVVDAVKGLADGAKNAFKSALGIASPSKVMMQMGAFAGQGVAEGMSAQAPDVHAASGDLAGAAAKGFGAGGGGAKGGGANINVTVNVDGAGKSAMQITEEMVSLVFERMALAQGLG